MSSSLELLVDACAGLPMTKRSMFGGHGLFAPNGGMFAAVVTDDEVIFKLADEKAKAELLKLGGHPWRYDGKPKAIVMASWIVVPASFYDDPEMLTEWARRAHRLAPAKAVAGKRPKKAPKAKPPSKPTTKRQKR
jgi:DNA transformation protein and related proteins